jgi:hypothetical protein
MRKITALFRKDGTVTVETTGYLGNACEEATRRIHQGLGKVTDDKPTPEMFQQLDGGLSITA